MGRNSARSHREDSTETARSPPDHPTPAETRRTRSSPQPRGGGRLVVPWLLHRTVSKPRPHRRPPRPTIQNIQRHRAAPNPMPGMQQPTNLLRQGAVRVGWASTTARRNGTDQLTQSAQPARATGGVEQAHHLECLLSHTEAIDRVPRIVARTGKQECMPRRRNQCPRD
jgi:hypothetical protein